MKSAEIALAGQVPTAQTQPNKPSVDDGLSDYLYKQLRGFGHVVEARLGDALSHATQLPKDVVASFDSQRRLWKSIAIAVPVAGIFVLAGAKDGVTAWQERSARIEAEAKAEVMRKDQEAKAAAAMAEAKAYADAFAAADKTLLAFMSGADALKVEGVYAKSSDILGGENQAAAIGGIREAVTSIVNGKPVDYAKTVDGVGAWPAAIVAKSLQADGGYMVGVAIDDNGTRKALVLYAKRTQSGEVSIVGIRSYAPELEAKTFVVDQAFKFYPFENVKERFVRGFMPAPAPAASASTN